MDLVKRYAGSQESILCVSHGGLYWIMLPLVLKNVSTELISEHGFDYLTCITAELREEGLFCIDWNGKPIERLVN